jgi:hypothetical protein
MNYNLFVQSIAIIALAVFALSFHAKTKKNIIIINTIGLIIFIIHFYLLQAWTGVMLNILNCVIAILLIFREENKYINNKIFLLSSLFILTLVTFFTWEGYHSIFALLGICFVTIAKWQQKKIHLRLIFILASLSWIIYDYFVGSSGGIISEIIIIISLFISIIRDRR